MKAQNLVAALLRDRQRPTATTGLSADCFLCGRSYVYHGPNGDNSGRFCSDRCREHYDAGERRVEPFDPFKVTKWRVIAGDNPGYLVATPMRMGKAGFHITCPGCQREFESTGSRYCSRECEQASRKHQENAATMAEVGMQATAKRPCQRPGCTDTIPNWRNGRRVSQRAQFCDFHTPSLRPQKSSEAAE